MQVLVLLQCRQTSHDTAHAAKTLQITLQNAAPVVSKHDSRKNATTNIDVGGGIGEGDCIAFVQARVLGPVTGACCASQVSHSDRLDGKGNGTVALTHWVRFPGALRRGIEIASAR